MNRQKLISAGVIGLVVVSLAVTAITASSQARSTPLYTVRMEQASSQMSFLPTERNAYTYTAEKGYTVDYDMTCGEYTDFFFGGITCPKTCPYTCEQTCPGICQETTCGYPICPPTCPYTCWQTCPVICPPNTS